MTDVSAEYSTTRSPRFSDIYDEYKQTRSHLSLPTPPLQTQPLLIRKQWNQTSHNVMPLADEQMGDALRRPPTVVPTVAGCAVMME
eukprot:6490328-Amphidinium_carterae.2